MSKKHVVVIGGSVAGLGVSLALSNRGHRVTVLESDATPLPPDHTEAFEKWKRKGSPQTRHSHALLARLRNLIRDNAPDLLETLKACGAEELRFTERVKELFDEPTYEEGDDDIISLACRRITFEWVLRRHVIDSGLVDFRDGVEVTRLEAEPPNGAPPRVTGVWLKEGRDGIERLLEADLVVDASGRTTKLGTWLPAIGTAPVREASSDCGIYYTSRFYQLRPGVDHPALDGGIVGVDLGYLKLGVFAGDSRVFSITLAASPADDPMRRILRQPGFDAAVAAVPVTAEWTAPGLCDPVTGVHGMSGLSNVRRWLVEEDRPLALGFVAVGDSLIHTNPIVGRGCSLSWVSAFDLAECVDLHDDPLDLALAYDACVEKNIVPWYDLQVTQDADAIDISEAQLRGEDPYRELNDDGSNNPKGFIRALIREGLIPMLEEDQVVLRKFLRTMNLLDPPGDLMQDPVVMQRVIASYGRRAERPKKHLGPSRNEMLEHLDAADAGRSVD